MAGMFEAPLLMVSKSCRYRLLTGICQCSTCRGSPTRTTDIVAKTRKAKRRRALTLTPNNDRVQMSDNTGGDDICLADVYVEKVVLARMLMNSEFIADVADTLRAVDFTLPVHQLVFDAIVDLYRAKQPTDTLTVSYELDRRGLSNRIVRQHLQSLLVFARAETNAAECVDRIADLARQRADSEHIGISDLDAPACTLGETSPINPVGQPAADPPRPSTSDAFVSRRRWPLFALGTAIGVVVMVVGWMMAPDRISGISTGLMHETVPSPIPAAAPPFALVDANQQTCNAWLSAGYRIRAAKRDQSSIPRKMSIHDPAVRANPAWRTAVQTASGEYQQAAEILAKGTAPDATAILVESAQAAVEALNVIATAYASFDDADGNAYRSLKKASETVDVMCLRFASAG